MPYEYHKYCPTKELRMRIALGIIICIGLIVSAYTLSRVYLFGG